MKHVMFVLSVLSTTAGIGRAREIWVDAASKSTAPLGTKTAAYRRLSPALVVARPGDTVVVRGGVYRESVRIPGGEPSRPVTVRAAAGERAIVSGAQIVGGWRRHKGLIFTATLAFRPHRLLLGFEPQTLARQPNEGWWVAASAEDTALIDPDHLKTLAHDPVGGEAYIWTKHGNTFFTVPVAALDRDKGRLAVTRKSKWMRLSPGDRYYLQNRPGLIDRPGEWAVVAEGAKFRLYYWPAKPADLDRIQAPREPRRAVLVADAKHVRIEGLEVVAAAKYGIEVHGCDDVTVSGCVVHDNGSMGISLRDCRNVTVRRNIAWRNYCGVTLHGVSGAVVEENDIGHNGMDGLIVAWKSADVTVRRNYVHHHLLWGHPDNIQLYRGVKNIRFEDNLLLAGGQSVMMEEAAGGVFKGNMIVGSGAYSVIFGHRNAEDFQIHNNTIAFAGYGCLSLTARGYDLRENVLMTGHSGCIYGARGVKGYTAMRNLLFNASGLTKKTVLASDKGWHKSLQAFQQATGQEKYSTWADPQFRNAPIGFAVLDSGRLADCTRDTWYLRKGGAPIGRGSMIEINFDGVVRKVTDARDATITVSPGLPRRPTKGWLVSNWGRKTDFSLDLRLRPTSPGATLTVKGGPVGSQIDIAAYRRGDFDADGKRDLPELPRELAPRRPQPQK